MTDRREVACRGQRERERSTQKERGSTYRRGSVELRAASGTFLSRRPPVTQQRQEKFREGATVVVWLHGRMERDVDKEDGRRVKPRGKRWKGNM